ncbi:hypothetical protein DO021_15475 [Desulfobacter hydrogenophilus]|uniref:Uncharacterized protein n=1 Tax=Desulfobacter hydrogenophilus TaxID=2291 RepID=A0A328F8Z8_9BACT|nr:hypothetical protein [Desulfobacter hydrogenophilus]NDY73082.1 hypothetical protein [Desulfobacter hydrogenophilus]QBH13568.1 hypothetical protein EYB58_11910 [Desulfobacter hydrogenophilus]RAM01088.1 hypothetical protein DO021_15475 [Desulfobacter hydrogenophilus]
MKKIFRLYENGKAKFESSVFDMITGEKETKQTKGLAYLLKEYPSLIRDILKLNKIRNHSCFSKKRLKLRWKEINSIEVLAEKITKSGNRVDIIIKINEKSAPLLAIIIEAKSIKSNIKYSAVIPQIEKYLEMGEISDLEGYSKIPIILTKFKSMLGSDDIISLTWQDIIDIISKSNERNKNNLIGQYYQFITGVNNKMHYYEKEVLSIPAGKTFDLVEKYKIYECPNNSSYNYKKTIFITFRNTGGGVMKKLYKIEDIIVFNPAEKSDLDRVMDSMTEEQTKKERLQDFIKECKYEHPGEEKKFYILSADEIIDLQNKPKPKRNNAKFTYYRLFDILTKSIVEPASKLS